MRSVRRSSKRGSLRTKSKRFSAGRSRLCADSGCVGRVLALGQRSTRTGSTRASKSTSIARRSFGFVFGVFLA